MSQHLFAENKEKLIHSALTAMISKDFGDDVNMLEQQFHALRRLVASKAGFSGFTSLPGFREKVNLLNNIIFWKFDLMISKHSLVISVNYKQYVYYVKLQKDLHKQS